MYKIFLSILIAAPSVLCAQSNFSITGNVKNLKTNDKVFLVYQEAGKQITDSVTVKEGNFKFNGTLKSPVEAYLFLNGNPIADNSIREIDYTKFYIEPGNINVNTNDSLKNIVITGSKINDEAKALTEAKKESNEKYKSFVNAANALFGERSSDKKLKDSLDAVNEALTAEKNDVGLSFAEQNPKSYLSLKELLALAPQDGYTKKVRAAYEKITPELKTTPLGKAVLESIEATEKTEIGKPAPLFSQNSTTGELVNLTDFKGKYVLVDFWASWCGPCRQENPNVVKAFNAYKDKNFTILGVSLDDADGKEDWLKAIEKDGLTWTQVSDLKGWKNEAAKLYGVQGIPANFLLDPQGKIIAKDLRGEDLSSFLEKTLNKN